MKKVSALLTALLLIMCFSFSASALTHKETYMTVQIPDGFVKDETFINANQTRYNYSAGTTRFITVGEASFSFDYSNVTDSDLRALEDEFKETLFSADYGYYFTEYPEATKVKINSKTGVRLFAEYFDPDLNQEVLIDMYLFTCSIYEEVIAFMSAADEGTSWYEDCLDSLVIGRGLLVAEPTENNSSAASNSSFNFGDFAYGLGRALGFGLIFALIVYFIKRVGKK